MKPPAPAKDHWIRADRLPTLEEIAWLQSAEGRAACRAMSETQPADTPAAIERWRQQLSPPQVSAAWAQVLLRRAARMKFSRADQMLFDRVGLEQCTDEVIAAHKARRFAGLARVADLCCGIGGDALALADGRVVVAVDWSAARAALAQHNASVYGHEITTQTGDVGFNSPEADAAHIDPDRRPTGQRRHDIESGSPGLPTLARIVARYNRVAIKLSPGSNFAELPFPAEIELISHHGECKQAVAWTGDFRQAHRRATVLPTGHSLAAQPGQPLDWPTARPPEPGYFLYEPDPAIIRANLVGVLARQFGLAPVDPHIAWLTGTVPISQGTVPISPENPNAPQPQTPPEPSEHPTNWTQRNGDCPLRRTEETPSQIESTKWGLFPSRVGSAEAPSALFRSFRVLDVQLWSAKSARTWLARHDIGTLQVKTRGFAGAPEAILKQLRPTGARPGVLFLTRLQDRPTAILAERCATAL